MAYQDSFLDTVLGEELARTIIRSLPELCEEVKELRSEVAALKEQLGKNEK